MTQRQKDQLTTFRGWYNSILITITTLMVGFVFTSVKEWKDRVDTDHMKLQTLEHSDKRQRNAIRTLQVKVFGKSYYSDEDE